MTGTKRKEEAGFWASFFAFFLVLGILAVFVLLAPTLIWLLYVKTGFAVSVGLPVFAWWEIVVGWLIICIATAPFRKNKS